MDKKSKKIIKEVIEAFWEDREKQIEQYRATKHSFMYLKLTEVEKSKLREDINNYKLPEHMGDDLLLEQLIKLNNLLDIPDKKTEIVDLEMQMKEAQAKKYIDTKEFEKIYNISQSSQKDYRGRLNDPLPFHQKVARGKIVYVVSEVEKWFDNQYK